MNTYLDCIPCFFKQTLEAARLNDLSQDDQRQLLNEIALSVPSFNLRQSPVFIAGLVHEKIRDHLGLEDPYKEIKKISNEKAKRLTAKLKKKLHSAEDPLRLALEYAIAGNLIDFGAKTGLNIDDELEKVVEREEQMISLERPELFQYDRFRDEIKNARSLLYLGDNAGEIVFDALLIEVIKKLVPECNIIFAARGIPVINDVTVKDAYDCGIDEFAEVVSSGVPLPGTVLDQASPKFLKQFKTADLVISKGQGNFEALYGVEGPIYFLFVAKCSVIAEVTNSEVGSVLLLHN